MLRLALCDDEASQRAATGELLRQYAQARPELAVQLSVFASGWELLAAVEEEGEGFDLYLLDIVMPELSGIELGMKLRELGCSGAIIYLTISPEYAVDSYAARAFYYLVKPVEPAQLYRVLDEAVQALEKQRDACVMVKTKEGLHLARFGEILYTELCSRVIHYYLADGSRLESVTVRSSFQEEMAPLLDDPRFFLCGASFVANLFYVTAVEKNCLRLDGGRQIPLARRLAAQAKRRWSDYWLEEPKGERL